MFDTGRTITDACVEMIDLKSPLGGTESGNPVDRLYQLGERTTYTNSGCRERVMLRKPIHNAGDTVEVLVEMSLIDKVTVFATY